MAVTREELQGRWTEFKGRLKERWGQLTDNEFTQMRGNSEQIVGVIQQKTGAARREVEEFIDQFMNEGEGMVNRIKDTARDYTQRASEALSDSYQSAEENLRQGYSRGEDMVRENPMNAVAAVFGIGIITGAIVTLLMRPSR